MLKIGKYSREKLITHVERERDIWLLLAPEKGAHGDRCPTVLWLGANMPKMLHLFCECGRQEKIGATMYLS